MVSIGMIGASISGVSLISVPGWVPSTQMTYLQMCMGFCVGYAICAFILLPLYYKLNLTSIYEYLRIRFGERTHHTGAIFFLLSKCLGACARLYLSCLVIHEFVAVPLHIPFTLTTGVIILLIWGYTLRGGMAVLVRTDVVQTICMIGSLILLFLFSINNLGWSIEETFHYVRQNEMSQVFKWQGDSSQNFWRQFLSGIFIVVVMTGLDQDMMQKNLTCRNLRAAQKNMCTYGISFLPINLLLLSLGIIFCAVYAKHGVCLPDAGDMLIPHAISAGWLGWFVVIPFALAIISAALSSADSALTALTTSIYVDILHLNQKEEAFTPSHKSRKWIHTFWALTLWIGTLIIYNIGTEHIIDTIYVIASYTYGPLLGLYSFGLFTHKKATDIFVPYICILGPVICGILAHISPKIWNYTFGYELLLLNGAITFFGLWATSYRKKKM